MRRSYRYYRVTDHRRAPDYQSGSHYGGARQRGYQCRRYNQRSYYNCAHYCGRYYRSGGHDGRYQCSGRLYRTRQITGFGGSGQFFGGWYERLYLRQEFERGDGF
jgi:hypothetical protein